MTVNPRTASSIVGLLAFLVATGAIAVHSPGHVSMDTSIQLYEATISRSVSWNPPFMSALMGWLGGGALATAGIVWISTVLTYGAYVVVARAMEHVRCSYVSAGLPAWRVGLAAILILNPVVALYVGIVWKDVLFAAFLTASSAFGISACVGERRHRWISSLSSLLLLAPALLIRQQGIFMTPVLVVLPAVALSSASRRPQKIWIPVIAIFAVAVFAFQAIASATIKGNDGRSSSQGFRSIMVFDMIGMMNYSHRSAAEFIFPITPNQLVAVREVYQPSRIDYIARNPVAEGWLASLTARELRHAWWNSIKQNPMAYVKHRATAYATLLGLRGIEPTQPVHVGVNGNVEYLRAANMTEGLEVRGQFAYDFSSKFLHLPIYRHAFWLVTLIACAVALGRAKLPPRLKSASALIIFAATLFFLSYLPTMISSDFRYLFAAIPLTTLVLLVLLLGSDTRPETPKMPSRA